ncbi:pentapeptide repeat-containing protein [Cellulomonas soli]
MATPRTPRTARTSPRTPRLDPVEPTALDSGFAGDLEPDVTLEGLAFDDLTLDELDLGGTTLLGCRLTGVSAGTADLKTARLRETVLERLDVPVIRGARSTWKDVRLEAGRIGSAELYESVWDQVHVVGCKLSFVNLRGARLRDVVFTDCVIEELDLVQASATRVALVGTKVGRLDVQHSTFEHVDLRGADIDEVAGISALGGAVISPLQLRLLAPALAAALGVVVDESTDPLL